MLIFKVSRVRGTIKRKEKTMGPSEEFEMWVKIGLLTWLIGAAVLGELAAVIFPKKPLSLGMGAVMGWLWPIGLAVLIHQGYKALRKRWFSNHVSRASPTLIL
ncbi:hypothetical protein HN748_02190 [Candidatus Peregrinibacteria bacterium]|nr:hypothetical protein [Candidatus Peregrinibacteria bacterium]